MAEIEAERTQVATGSIFQNPGGTIHPRTIRHIGAYENYAGARLSERRSSPSASTSDGHDDRRPLLLLLLSLWITGPTGLKIAMIGTMDPMAIAMDSSLCQYRKVDQWDPRVLWPSMYHSRCARLTCWLTVNCLPGTTMVEHNAAVSKLQDQDDRLKPPCQSSTLGLPRD
ncbi:hypothetical protein DFH06DRAFT_529479 [Mycena polygramma]|nr:hypothetical protein DFH06DRAFT_529479 [Mycena polygramma]